MTSPKHTETIPPIACTKRQKKYLQLQRVKTGESMAGIIRNLIDKDMEGK